VFLPSGFGKVMPIPSLYSANLDDVTGGDRQLRSLG
jgi:hypothetical protein